MGKRGELRRLKNGASPFTSWKSGPVYLQCAMYKCTYWDITVRIAIHNLAVK